MRAMAYGQTIETCRGQTFLVGLGDCAVFQAVWAKLGSKRLLWERMRALFYDYALASMRQLFGALLYGFKKSSPLVTMDSS
jgi:ATP phosphoribosyltransferase regulatory subunit HisZ